VTDRLVATAIDHWDELEGYGVAHGMKRLENLPLDRFCAFVYYMLTRSEDEAGIRKLRADLWRPPKNVAVMDSRSPWAPVNELDALKAFKAQAAS